MRIRGGLKEVGRRVGSESGRQRGDLPLVKKIRFEIMSKRRRRGLGMRCGLLQMLIRCRRRRGSCGMLKRRELTLVKRKELTLDDLLDIRERLVLR